MAYYTKAYLFIYLSNTGNQRACSLQYSENQDNRGSTILWHYHLKTNLQESHLNKFNKKYILKKVSKGHYGKETNFLLKILLFYYSCPKFFPIALHCSTHPLLPQSITTLLSMTLGLSYMFPD